MRTSQSDIVWCIDLHLCVVSSSNVVDRSVVGCQDVLTQAWFSVLFAVSRKSLHGEAAPHRYRRACAAPRRFRCAKAFRCAFRCRTGCGHRLPHCGGALDGRGATLSRRQASSSRPKSQGGLHIASDSGGPLFYMRSSVPLRVPRNERRRLGRHLARQGRLAHRVHAWQDADGVCVCSVQGLHLLCRHTLRSTRAMSTSLCSSDVR